MTRGRQLELAWSEFQGRSCLRVRGWTEAEFRELGGLAAGNIGRRLAVVLTELVDSGEDWRVVPPVAGRFQVDQDAVCFVPRFPFQDGISYSLLVDLEAEERRVDGLEVWTARRPVPQRAPTTEVVAVYPTAEELPVNQLKLYVYFSSPMSEGWAARAVQVRRADNDAPLEDVFLAAEPELWDRERRRLTLLLDPGRIKRGLAPHQEAGYPLIEGVPVIVTIGSEFRDAAGRPLRADAQRRYQIGPPVRVRVVPSEWRCYCPDAGSMDQLIVEFDRPLDYALLEHSLWVNRADGRALAVRGSKGAGERSWRFEPQAPWEKGQHQLVIDPWLEDLAGNSLTRVFDRDLTRVEDDPTDTPVAINFTCALPRGPH